jgi:hypothetical protein
MRYGNGKLAREQAVAEFVVESSLQADIDILSLLQRVKGLPMHDIINQALLRGVRKLRAEARTCGEPRYHYRGMNMTVYVYGEKPLVFEYGVHDNAQVVVIRRIFRLGS